MATITDSTTSDPLLQPNQRFDEAADSVITRSRPPRPPSPNRLALLLGRASGGPSTRVRETAAMQLEERRADWGYSKPVVALDIAWNLAFTIVSVVMIVLTLKERPNTPIRVWIIGYAVQCVVHVIMVWLEYRRRSMRRIRSIEDGGSRTSDSDVNDSEDEGVDPGGYRTVRRSSIAKRCESINTMASFLWWIVGFYWVVAGGEILMQNAPRLYWMAVVFLAFDVFFAIFCVALACVIGIALCCCLPCIIAILYAVAGQDGASESDLSILPKYRFQISTTNEEKPSEGGGKMVPIAISNEELADERVLSADDTECCICLTSYEDGAEIHALPCNHHFHATCIVKWLKINASCPLCKYNILKGNEQV